MKTSTFILLLSISVLPAFAAADAPSTEYIPCRVHQRASASFPLRLSNEGVKHGEATVVLEIDSSGKVVDELVTGYTRREFADEIVRTVKRWAFEPGTVKGEPVTSVVSVKFEFSIDGILVYEQKFDTPRTDPYAERTLTYFAHGSETLDRKPVALHVPAPLYPEAWANQGRCGKVTVRFYIDEDGRVRLPTVDEQQDQFLASVAVAAVRQWHFEPPMFNGVPVLAYAEQSFVFEPPVKVSNKT